MVDGAARLFDVPEFLGGLVADFGEGSVVILTGVNAGPVLVTVATTSSAPDLDHTATWEDIVEASVEADDSGLDGMVVVGPEDEPPAESARLDVHGGGWYRLRVSARGRDIAYDLTTDEPVEHYLVQAWPQAPSPPSVIAASSRLSRE